MQTVNENSLENFTEQMGSNYSTPWERLRIALSTKKVARVLSVCGGGLRGIIPATYLNKLETESLRLTRDMFHMVAGTSTGGLIACGISKYSADDLVKIYENEGSEFFVKRPWIVNPWGLLNSTYKSTPLINKYKEHFGDETLRDIIGYDTLITYYDLTNRAPRFFKSHRAKITNSENYYLYDALGCTSAAPTYFKSHPLTLKGKLDPNGYDHIRGIHVGEAYIDSHETNPFNNSQDILTADGGLVANDPTLCALTEACDLYANADAYLIVSIDTGKYLEPLSPTTLIEWGTSVPDICMSGAESMVHHIIVESGRLYDKEVFKLKISLDIPEEYSAMDNSDNVGPLKALADADTINIDKITQLANLLRDYEKTSRDEILRTVDDVSSVIEL